MKARIGPALLLAALVSAGAVPHGPAQELFYVTGVTQADAATLTPTGGAAQPMTLGRAVAPGQIQVTDGAQVMLFESSGAVASLFGPADVVVGRDDLTGGIQLALNEGRLAFAVARATGAGRTLTLTTHVAGQVPTDVEITAASGTTYLLKKGSTAGVAYVADESGETLSVRVNDALLNLASGQRVLIEAGGQPDVGPLGPWLAQQGFLEAWGRKLGVAAARAARPDIELNLFNNIIAWDRYAGAAYVVSRLREEPFNLEIRQTVTAVRVQPGASTRGNTVETVPFPGANAVPIVSPAAASVQDLRNVGQGVTAIQLNANAAQLLAATGSQGLGFNGPAQLAIPGFTAGGQRTTGPAGLGAQR